MKIRQDLFGHKKIAFSILDYPKIKVTMLLRGSEEKVRDYAEGLRKVMTDYIKLKEDEIR